MQPFLFSITKCFGIIKINVSMLLELLLFQSYFIFFKQIKRKSLNGYMTKYLRSVFHIFFTFLQIQQMNHIQPALRGLKTLSNLRWTDFSMKSTNPVVVGSRVFHQAMWGTHNVTVAVSAGTIISNTMSLGTFNLTPIIEFSDLIPQSYLATFETIDDDNKQIQGKNN